VTADPARLQQVFWNLVRNAVKFTPDGGDIAIRTWGTPESGQLFVEVKDTGVGIPAEVLPRVFDAFEQGDVGTTRQFGGLGLGLAIAKAVVEMHGGTISAASDGPGLGAAFTVRLDAVSGARAVESQSPDAAVEPQQQGRRAKVLLVEDHPDTVRTMARLLRNSGYKVRTAHSVASALRLADAEPFDIVVSDIGLPDATGYNLMQRIRDRYGLKGIALSGYGMEDDLRKSREAGFVEHVTKPVNMGQLQILIDRVANITSDGV
jgi:CheY-like chemotaxis protein